MLLHDPKTKPSEPVNMCCCGYWDWQSFLPQNLIPIGSSIFLLSLFLYLPLSLFSILSPSLSKWEIERQRWVGYVHRMVKMSDMGSYTFACTRTHIHRHTHPQTCKGIQIKAQICHHSNNLRTEDICTICNINKPGAVELHHPTPGEHYYCPFSAFTQARLGMEVSASMTAALI